MKTDEQLKADVCAELDWDPAVNATSIGVAVHEGVVTLGGAVASYLQKHAAERAVRRVAGVRGIALDLAVQRAANGQPPDTAIAQAALEALRWHAGVPHEALRVEVEDGHLILSGEVPRAVDAVEAERCVRPLVGVQSVANRISVRSRGTATDISARIAAALARHAQRDARHIAVEVDGEVATLRGTVHSLRERDAVVGTTRCAPGISRIVDLLQVSP